MTNDEATLTVKIVSTEELQNGPVRGPTPAPQPPQSPRTPPPPSSLIPPISESWAMERAIEAMRAEAEREAIDLARRRIDAEYDLRQKQKEFDAAHKASMGDTWKLEKDRDAWLKEQAAKASQRERDAIDIDRARRAADPAYDLRRAEEEIRRKRLEEMEKDRQERWWGESRPHDDAWAAEQAAEAVKRVEEARMIEQARRQIDPTYDLAKKKAEAEKQRKEEAEQLRDRRSWAGSAAIGLQAAGMPGLAGIAGGYAAGSIGGSEIGGTIGAVIGAVKMVIETIRAGIESAFKFGGGIAAMDADRVSRGMANLVSNIPLVGGLMGTLANGFLDLSDAVAGTARRLSQYSGELATQMAMYEVRLMNRDIERAQRFGPQIMAAMEARQNFQDKINDFIDKHTPTILKIAEAGLGMLEGLLNGIDGVLTAVKDFPDVLTILMNPVTGYLEVEARRLRAIQEALEQQNTQAAASDNALTQLATMQQGFQDLMQQAPAALPFTPAVPGFGVPGPPAGPGGF